MNALPAAPGSLALIDEYRTDLKRRGRSPNTVEAYAGDVQAFYARQGIPLVEVTSKDVGEDMRRAQSDRGIKPSSILRYVTSLTGFYTHLVRTGTISKNPVTSVQKPRVKKCRRTVSRVTQEELEKLLRDAEWESPAEQRSSLVLRFCAETGAEISQLIALKLSDVDLMRGAFAIRDRTGRRTPIIMSKDLLQRTREYVEGCRAKITGWEQSVYLFPSKEGNGHLCRQAIWYMLKGRAKKVGLTSEITTNDLRKFRRTRQAAR
jgi:integrase/recombinase XerD